jgi:S1-C subfamily serine protease
MAGISTSDDKNETFGNLRRRFRYALPRVRSDPNAAIYLPEFLAFGAKLDAAIQVEMAKEDAVTDAEAAAAAADGGLDRLSRRVSSALYGGKKVDVTLPAVQPYYGGLSPSEFTKPQLGGPGTFRRPLTRTRGKLLDADSSLQYAAHATAPSPPRAALSRLCVLAVSLGMLVACQAHRAEPVAASDAGTRAPVAASDAGTRATETPSVLVESPAPWASTASTQWPQLVLTNETEFRAHSSLSGASAFLVVNSHGRVVATTAKHLLGDAGGVRPTLGVDELAGALVRWVMFPRTQPNQTVEVAGIAIPGLNAPDRDWLVLSLRDTSRLPAVPLRLRRRPVSVGERVYLIGCPYTEPACRQNVYAGKVTARSQGDAWRFDIDPPVKIPGFSGAPIVDANGLVVGVTTIWFDPRMSGSLWLESGGEDVGGVFDAIEALH